MRGPNTLLLVSLPVQNALTQSESNDIVIKNDGQVGRYKGITNLIENINFTHYITQHNCKKNLGNMTKEQLFFIFASKKKTDEF